MNQPQSNTPLAKKSLSRNLHLQKSTVCGYTGSKRDERENQKPKTPHFFTKG